MLNSFFSHSIKQRAIFCSIFLNSDDAAHVL